jgi:hypothetical protein
MSRLLTVTFTTAAFVRSSSRLFGASSYQAAPKGLPSSFAQHDAFASSRHTINTKRTPLLQPRQGGKLLAVDHCDLMLLVMVLIVNDPVDAGLCKPVTGFEFFAYVCGHAHCLQL